MDQPPAQSLDAAMRIESLSPSARRWRGRSRPASFRSQGNDDDAGVVAGREQRLERGEAGIVRSESSPFAMDGPTAQIDVGLPRITLEGERLARGDATRRQRFQINQFTSWFHVSNRLLQGTRVTLRDGDLREDIKTASGANFKSLFQTRFASMRRMEPCCRGAATKHARAGA